MRFLHRGRKRRAWTEGGVGWASSNGAMADDDQVRLKLFIRQCVFEKPGKFYLSAR